MISLSVRLLRPKTSLSTLLLLLWLPSIAVAAGSLSVISNDQRVRVAYIYDGDTFRSSRGEKIRLLGINTPEVGHNRQAAQPFSRQARQRLQQLIGGKTVRLRLDQQHRGNYDRLLAQVYLPDHRWVNEILVREGLAHVYTFEPNHRWTARLLAAEQRAQRARTGIWGTPRFKVLDASSINDAHIGQYRLIQGTISHVKPWQFQLGEVRISIPEKYRPWFKQPPAFRPGQQLTLRGVIRTTPRSGYYLALHSPFDMQ